MGTPVALQIFVAAAKAVVRGVHHRRGGMLGPA